MSKKYWDGALTGEPLPGVKIPFPPKFYPLAYNASNSYRLKDGEEFLGIWGDGTITFCKYDKSGDYIRTIEGAVYTTGGTYGGPSWIIPLESF